MSLPAGTPAPLVAVVETAAGRAHRRDPVTGVTGGPAGNARLTAWLGLTLLALFLAELVSLLDVRSMITWHIAVGAVLIPPSLLKTATTGWRIFRYYTGATDYVHAGPPPLLLRLLGPLVIVGTLALLGTGVLVGVLGPDSGRQPLVAGAGISPLTLHQASFIVWGVATGLHVLARTVPATRLVLTRPAQTVPGAARRGGALVASLVAGALLVPLLLAASHNWRAAPRFLDFQHRGAAHGGTGQARTSASG